jgi:transposase
MVDIEFIRKKHFKEEWSIRKIANALEISRQSVRKALTSSSAPSYQLTKSKPAPTLGSFHAVIDQWLKEDEKSPVKQRHTATRIYQRLVDEHSYRGCESNIRRYVRLKKQKTPEAFVPLTADFGEQAQVDWGTVLLTVGGRLCKVSLFCLKLKASGVPFVAAFPTEKMEAFFAGHQMAFQWLGGVPDHCVYDNLKTAIVRILENQERQEHIRFSNLRAHYLFASRFCNRAKGNEKGAVEHLVGYVRRNALVPDRGWADWDDLHTHLKAWCEAERLKHKPEWEQEKRCLQPLPATPFSCATVTLSVVASTCLIAFDRNHYSVPCQYVGQTVSTHAFWDTIRIYVKGQCIAEHPRGYEYRKSYLKLDHYLPVLEKKPRAADQAVVVRQLGPVWDQVRTVVKRSVQGNQELVKLLCLFREFPAEAVTASVEQALSQHQLSAMYVRQLLLNRGNPRTSIPITVPDHLLPYRPQYPDLKQYDGLARKGVLH